MNKRRWLLIIIIDHYFVDSINEEEESLQKVDLREKISQRASRKFT